jgi:putative ABC transport system ATP-binding protein
VDRLFDRGLSGGVVSMIERITKSDTVLAETMLIRKFLRTLPLFEKLSPAELTNVAEKMKRRRFAKGDVIIREGDPGEEFFVIKQGSVRVLRGSGADEPGRELATLGPGNCFGERALITDEPRNATVAAREAVEVYALDKDDFLATLATSPGFQDQLRKIDFKRQ